MSVIQRQSLRAQVKDVILQRIVAGEYAPGERLVETRIAQELGSSQAPVREALRDLEQLGCVVHEPNRGCSVRAFSVDELLEAFPVRAALEGLAAREAAARITDGELDRLQQHLDDMRAAAADGDAHAQSQANAAFHALIVDAARNATLARQWALLEPFSRTFISASAPGIDLRELAERHVGILAALRARDPQAAHDAMHRHLLDAADFLRPRPRGALAP